MKNDASQSEGKKRNRRLAAVASLLLLIPLGVFGTLFYRQSQAAMNRYPDRRPWDDPQVAAAMRKVRLTQAQALRDRYGKWAEQHQDGLKKLLRSKDQAALLAWYQATDPTKHGGPISDRDPESGKRGYSWSADRSIIRSDKLHWTNPADEALSRDALKKNFELVQKDYDKFGDYKIAGSMSIGPASMAIWASGRITVEKVVPKTEGRITTLIDAPPAEVISAFDFLR